MSQIRFVNGIQVFISDDKPEVNEYFIDLEIGFYHIAEDVMPKHVVRSCDCDKCTREDKMIPIETCRKVRVIQPEEN